MCKGLDHRKDSKHVLLNILGISLQTLQFSVERSGIGEAGWLPMDISWKHIKRACVYPALSIAADEVCIIGLTYIKNFLDISTSSVRTKLEKIKNVQFLRVVPTKEEGSTYKVTEFFF